MPYETLNLGLNLTLPTAGTSNWGPTLKNTTWTRISQHQHTGSGDGSQLVNASYADHSITINKLEKNAGLYQLDAPLVPAGVTETLDFGLGSIQTLDLGAATGDVDLTLSNGTKGGKYTIWVIQGATPRDLNWPVTVKWPQGQKPILTQDNDAIDCIELYFNGSAYLGRWQNDWK